MNIILFLVKPASKMLAKWWHFILSIWENPIEQYFIESLQTQLISFTTNVPDIILWSISSSGWKGYFTTLFQHWYYCWYQLSVRWYRRYWRIWRFATKVVMITVYLPRSVFLVTMKLFLANSLVLCPLRLILQAYKPGSLTSGSRLIIQLTGQIWVPVIAGQSSRISFNDTKGTRLCLCVLVSITMRGKELIGTSSSDWSDRFYI